MAQKTVNTRIRFKRDTSANWTNNNPVLLNGEIIAVDTTGGEVRFKVGDGIKTYTQLPFQDEFVRNLIADKADADHTHFLATESMSGFMGAADKEKLDGIEENANNYSHPTYTYRNLGLYKVSVNSMGHVSSATNVTKNDITALGIPGENTTYDPATTSSDGLMSAEDKVKLNGISENANAVSFARTATSGSPIGTLNIDGTGTMLYAPAPVYQTGITTSGSGSAYTATVAGITSLTRGASFIMIPHVVSTSTAPTLNVNGLGARPIRRRYGYGTSSTTTGYSNAWLGANVPHHVIYDGTYWIVEDTPKPSANDLSGTVSSAQVSNLMQWKVDPLSSAGQGSITVNRNTNGFFGLYNVTQSGLYYLWYQIWFQPNEYDKTCTMFLDSTDQGEISVRGVATCNATIVNNSGIFMLPYGDTIQCRVFHNCTNAQNIGYKYGVMLLRT